MTDGGKLGRLDRLPQLSTSEAGAGVRDCGYLPHNQTVREVRQYRANTPLASERRSVLKVGAR